MSNTVIPEDARQFLLQNVDSIGQWEGLLLMRGHPGLSWTAAEVARNLYISETEADEALAPLVERRILARDGAGFIYRPATPELDDLIGRVADLYRQYLIPVTHVIHAKPQKPAKSRVQEFANAFRIRKD